MEAIIFSSYLKKLGDTKNRILLTNDKLVVIFNGKVQAYFRSNVLSLIINKKKLIIPLVFGGIGTSLSMIATSMGWYDRQIILFITLVFFGVLYYGFVGKDALELTEKGNNNIFLLGGNLTTVMQFINFFNATKNIHSNYSNLKIYHIATKKAWEEQIYNVNYNHISLENEGFIHASTAEHLLESYNLYYETDQELILLDIIPELLAPEVKYELAERRNAYFPHIFGTINKTSIQSVNTFSSEEALVKLITY
jgi:uncharacterized protein (DUF952 family)